MFPVWKRIWNFITQKISVKNTALELTGRTFFLSSLSLFLLIGFVIPSNLIVSDVAEFSFLEHGSPLSFVGTTVLQSAGILLWLICIYFLSNRRVRIIITAVLTVALSTFLLNTFIFTGNYGTMFPDLAFDGFTDVSMKLKIINIISIFLICLFIAGLLLIKKRMVILSLQGIVAASLLCFGFINAVKIQVGHRKEQLISVESSTSLEKIITLSQTGKNVLVIVLDMAAPRFLPYIFEEKPELIKNFDGFVFYPNTVSFGPQTIIGMPCIFGGYYYSPLEIQKRTGELFLDKYYESMMVLPRIMADANFRVTVQDQSDMDNSLYDKYDNIDVQNTKGKYTRYFLGEFGDLRLMDYQKQLYANFLRFSLFKISPMFFRRIIYNNGDYRSVFIDTAYSRAAIGNYTSLYYMPDITEVTDKNENHSILFVNNMTHVPAFMEAPDYVPSNNITNKGQGPFANDEYYHSNMASYLLLAKWFDFLKENNVYDNTRIIIVSDHGNNTVFPERVNLPNGRELGKHSALLMVKDFNANSEFETNDSFMTNADVPYIAVSGFAEKVINPFNGKELPARETNDATVTTGGGTSIFSQNKYTLKIGKNEWLHVRDNIYDPANWSSPTMEK
ncbi:MAG: alkaline phosphatase family protein [Treponema sp.]|nr:alkaline phosphatase family protein [Treponema sp.]